MFIEQLSKDPRFFFAMLITIVVSICLHELAHGFAAIWLGDRTPIESGHMTLSPFVHMGVVSLICLLLAGRPHSRIHATQRIEQERLIQIGRAHV